MRKLKLHSAARYSACRICMSLHTVLLTVFMLFMHLSIYSQCSISPGNIEGLIFNDINMDGLNDDASYIGNVMVKAFDSNGTLVGQDVSSSLGTYTISGLTDGDSYRLEFTQPAPYVSALSSADSGTSLQFVNAPSCDANLGFFDPNVNCNENPPLILTCFVQGVPGINDMMETIIKLEHDFSVSSTPSKIANKAETGSVWGVAWDAERNRVYSSSFVKQNAHLSPYGAGAIFATDMAGTPSTSKWITLDEVGVDVGTSAFNFNDCDYGSQVGRFGIGNIVIDDNYQFLYVMDLTNKQIVRIDIADPRPSTTETYAIPDPGCNGGENAPFALELNNGKLYVGTTCTAEYSKLQSESTANVFEFDLTNKNFNLIFQTNYIKGHWYDSPSSEDETMHWLTDIAFTDEGNMLISLSDRVGHRFCNPERNRLDFQNPDLLTVWNDGGTWTLESNGTAGSLTGSGVGNTQGPGGGEFFGLDYWLAGPNYHPEIALGSIFVLPGSGEVVAAVYDPLYDTYSGGLHRYVTATGKKAGAIQLYTHNIGDQFGKATGFGEITNMCERPQAEIGNYVWIDANSNGIQEAGEDAIVGVEVLLINDNCEVVGTTTTSASGQYVFNDTNVDNNLDGVFDGLNYNQEYYVTLDLNLFDKDNGHYTYGGSEYVTCSNNIGFGENADLNDNDIAIAGFSCSLLDQVAFIPVSVTQSNSVNHDYDIGLCPKPENTFDLALIKILLTDPLVQLGDTAIFEMQIYNQGTTPASDITVVDYLVDGYAFLEDLNPDWRLRDGLLKTNFDGVLNPGEELKLWISLEVIPSSTLNFINVAEISGAMDATTGLSGVDVDSSPDDDPVNDAGGVPNAPLSDNILTGDGTVDEDDHDPETVMILDLALKKELKFPTAVYKAGDDVPYIITIYNQGNEIAHNIVVTDYIPEELFFDPAKNSSNWTLLSSDMAEYSDPDNFLVGDVREYEIVMTIKDNVLSGDILNYAEISNSESINDPRSRDFDSRPDREMLNDMGGQPNTNNDDRVDDFGREDEDDHDPALLRLDFFDLALLKTSSVQTASPGDLVDYTITVINQGTITANNVVVYDYIPAGMTLADSDWAYLNNDPSTNIAFTTLTVPGGITASMTVGVDITLMLSATATESEYVNIAEISSAQDSAGVDRSDDDVDSTPDGSPTNDMGGEPGSNTDDEINDDGTVDEDDHDPSRIIIVTGSITSENMCLGNATTAFDGQFLDEITISSASGETWYIVSINNLFDPASAAPPAVPTAFVAGPTGATLTETVLGNGLSSYAIQGVHIDAQGYSVTFTNGQGAFETVTSLGGRYIDPVIAGALAACTGSLQVEYSTTPVVGATYAWTLASGGVITSPTDGPSILVDWGAVNGDYDLQLVMTLAGTCYAPAVTPVALGSVSGGLSCIGDINISLGADCLVQVTPQMLLTSPINPASAYAVILMDANGNLIPNAILTGDYLNTPIMAKVMDGCDGNSCWSTVTVEDKVAPVIDCQDITISCNDMLDYQGPLAIDNCDGSATVTLVSETIEELTCDAAFAKIITQQYIAIDASGNQSDVCEIKISLERLNFADIVPPTNFMISDNTNLSCGQYAQDENGFPSTITTGTPTIDGQPLYPTFSTICNVVAAYDDVEIVMSGCSRKIQRTWTIYEWTCSDNLPVTIVQTIEVQDDTAPTIECPADMVLTTSGFGCNAQVTLPTVVVNDECSDVSAIEVDVQYPNGFLDNQNGGVATLPVGIHTITYVAYDECYNSSTCTMTVEIADNTAPVTICKLNTIVSINQTGAAEVFAANFDNGSYDDCSLDRFEVRRMDGATPCGVTSSDFSNSVNFCCADVGTEVMVVFRAYDASGNFNDCMVTIEVQDKFGPTITGPADLTIQCTDSYDVADLSSFGVATATDACGFTMTESANATIDQCMVGTIVRTFSATDGQNTATTTQTITIENNNPFNPATDIVWPADYASSSACAGNTLAPENLPAINGFPIVTEDACDLVAISYVDQVFQFVSDTDACFKILRKWTVIDWCQSVPGSVFQVQFDQVLKISNTDAPTFVGTYDPISVDSFDPDCLGAFVTLEATATDLCTPDNLLNWTYIVDIDSDGVDLLTQSGVSATTNANATYPLGNHTIFWSFEDGCGNVVTTTQLFSVVNKKAPVAYCINGLSIALEGMDLDGDGTFDDEMACLFVTSVDAGSYSTCGLDVNVSFSADVNDDKITFSCLDIGVQDVDLWVTDANGNTSFCSTTVEVQDNNDVDICTDPKDCITFPAANIQVATCNANLDPVILNSMPTVATDCVCTDFTTNFVDVTNTNTANNCTSVTRTWTVTFNCGTNPLNCTFVQTIELLNQATPIVTCPAGPIMGNAVLGTCNADLVVAIPVVVEDCISSYTVINNSTFATSNIGAASGSYPVGTTNVMYTVTDICGNSATCTVDVIVADITAPECNVQNLTVTLVNDQITIQGADLNAGSTDACSNDLTLDVNPSVFDCDNIGDNTVVVTVTDATGNTCTATATVTVIDEVAPVCILADVTIQVDDLAVMTLDASVLNNGSTDSCGEDSDLTFTVVPGTFGCSDIGVNTVTVTVTDLSGNTTTCTTTVTVVDAVAPVCVLQDITVSIGADNMVVVDAGSLDNGSTDACGTIVSFTSTPVAFDCSQIGDNTVTITVTDDSGNTSTCQATVTVEDVAAPVCNVMDITVTLDATGQVDITGDDLNNGSSAGCNGDVTLSVVPSFFACNDIGENTVAITVTDQNGNTTTCSAIVTVTDETAPVCVLQDLTVNVVNGTTFTIDAAALDNGSTDDCGSIVSYEANPTTLDCTNVGINTVTVIVTDNGGNTTTCTTSITVIDDTPPLCIVQDITVAIGNNSMVVVNPSLVDNGSLAGCTGSVSLSLSENTFDCTDLGDNTVVVTVTDDNGNTTTCTSIITVTDNDNPAVTCPSDITIACTTDISDLSVFGVMTINNTCAVYTIQETVVSDINACNAGVIVRTFTATNTVNGTTIPCSQVITISDPVNPLTLANITFPQDTFMISDCSSIAPEDLPNGQVVIDDTGLDCSMITVDFVDFDSTPNGNCALDTIVRTFTIVDLCQLDENNANAGMFTFEQILIVIDTIAPVIVGPVDITVQCEDNELLLPATVTDCNDVTVTNDSPFATTNIGPDASGIYPVGVTTVTILATDICGLSSSHQYVVTVQKDTIAPVFECKKLIFDIDDDQMVTLFPLQHVCALSDDQTDSVDIQLFFTIEFDNAPPDTLEFLNLDCDDLSSFTSINVIAVDQAGNASLCKTGFTFLDPNGFCPNGITEGTVEGLVLTENNQQVNNVKITLEGSGFEPIMTDDFGVYAFPVMETGGVYMVQAERDTDILEGVSTLDLIMIQRHILGIGELDSPYKHIAADINNSKSITGIDLIELRKVLLGILPEFPNNESWRLLDQDYQFDTNDDPLDQDFNESLPIDPFLGDLTADFVGVKIGDVNSSWTNDDLVGPTAESRSNRTIQFSTADLSEGLISFTSMSNVKSYGLQLELQMPYNSNIFNVTSDLFDVNDAHWTYRNGKLMISISSQNLIEIKTGDVVLKIGGTENISSELIQLTNDELHSELYDQELNIVDVILENTIESSFRVFQNEPNPWSEYTTIAFRIPTAQEVQVSIFDSNAKVVYQKTAEYGAGENSMKIHQSEINSNGLFYVELQLANGTKQSIKMIVLR